MVDREAELHVNAYKASGAELIFVGPKAIEVSLNQGRHQVACRQRDRDQCGYSCGNSGYPRP